MVQKERDGPSHWDFKIKSLLCWLPFPFFSSLPAFFFNLFDYLKKGGVFGAAALPVMWSHAGSKRDAELNVRGDHWGGMNGLRDGPTDGRTDGCRSMQHDSKKKCCSIRSTPPPPVLSISCIVDAARPPLSSPPALHPIGLRAVQSEH